MEPERDSMKGPDDLEKFIHEELRRLPDVPAPAAMVAQLMSKLERRRELPWWRRSFWNWPTLMQYVALIFFGALGVGTMGLVLWPGPTWGPAVRRVSSWTESGLAYWETVQGGWTWATTWVGSWAQHPWLLAAAAAMVMGYLAFVGLGTILVSCGRSHARVSLRS